MDKLKHQVPSQEKENSHEHIENSWEIFDPEEGNHQVEDLVEAVNRGDTDYVYELLEDPRLMRSLIVFRGPEKRFVTTALNSAQLILLPELGVQTFSEISSDQLLQSIEAAELSPTIIGDLTQIAYHLKDEQLMQLAVQASADLAIPEIDAHVQHNLASWMHTRENDPVAALRINSEVIKQSREIGERVIELKAMCGLKLQRDYKKYPLDQAQDLIKIAHQMFEIGHYYDGLRAQEEAAKIYLDVAQFHYDRNQPNDLDKALDYLKGAHDYALDSFIRARDMNYPIAQIKAAEVLSKMFALKNQIQDHKSNRRRIKRYQAISQSLKEEFDYLG